MEELVKNPSLSVLIFVVASTLITRALDAGLKSKLPKWTLPLLAFVVGAAGQVTTGLLGGLGWKQALMLGAAAGLGGPGLYSTVGKRVPGMKAKDR